MRRPLRCSCTSHNGFLTDRGYTEVAQREAAFHAGVDMGVSQLYLDSISSVSGLRRDEDLGDFMIDDQK